MAIRKMEWMRPEIQRQRRIYKQTIEQQQPRKISSGTTAKIILPVNKRKWLCGGFIA